MIRRGMKPFRTGFRLDQGQTLTTIIDLLVAATLNLDNMKYPVSSRTFTILGNYITPR